MPSNIPITRIGIWAPRSATKSNRFAPTRGSRDRAQNSRTFGSSAFIFAGEHPRQEASCIVWTGGSEKMSTPGGISIPDLIISRMGAL